MAPRLNLSHFFKGSFEEDPDVALQALMRSILIRTQFLPTVRHVIGWRGLKQLSAAVEGWTAKIRDCAGVFAQFFMGVEPTPGWATGVFGLCYFPDPKEPLVERCSLRAAAFTQTEDYRHCIRDFLRHPEMCELFAVGSLLLSLRTDRRALALALESTSALRTVAADGVRLEQEGQLITLVEPGGFDQDFPAFETAAAFFDVLAASVSFNLELPPGHLIEQRYSATQRVYDRSGKVSSQDAPGLWNGLVLLGYGDGDFDAFCSAVSATKSAPIATARADGPEAADSDYRDKLWWRAHQLKDSKGVDKKILGVDERPPLIILTGFLGSGKTSFLQHFIEYQTQRSRFVAVIQNEIGEIGLDGKLLDYTVTEIDEGCVCCSLAGNLKRAIQGILENFSPDTIILETSGVSNPKNLLDEIGELTEMVRFDCTATVVDALNFETSIAEYGITAEQIHAADLLILNKRDLVDDSRLQEVRRRLKDLNPNAPIFPTTRGDLNPALIFDVDGRLGSKERKSPGASVNPDEWFRHPSHSQDGLWSRSLDLPHTVDRSKFEETVASLPPSVFRAKGIVAFSDSPQIMLFQYVGGRWEISAFSGSEVHDRFITVIGRGDVLAGIGPLASLAVKAHSREQPDDGR
jgi:G3E family GTPase